MKDCKPSDETALAGTTAAGSRRCGVFLPQIRRAAAAASTPALAAAIAIAASACGAAPSRGQEPAADEAAAATEPPAEADLDVSAARIETHLRFLASDALRGRMTGTPGYDAAAAYVASRFEAFGLEPAGDDDYFQSVRYAASDLDAGASGVTLYGPDGARELAWQEEFVMRGDAARERTSVRAPAVFVGHGVRAPEYGHDDYAEIDAEGRVVVAVSGSPDFLPTDAGAFHATGHQKRQAAADAGAVGLVKLRSAYAAEHYPWTERMRNAGAMPAMRWLTPAGEVADHVSELRGEAVIAESVAPGLFRGAPTSYDDVMSADASGEALPAFPLEVEVELERESAIEHIESPNVVGLLPGSDPELADEHVVYSAHLDHLGEGAPVDGDSIYNGAYDNAMGISILLETARALSALEDPPRRSILFVAVGAEETGLRGSDHFARHPGVSGRLAANINLDMPLFLYPVEEVVAFGAEHSTMAEPVERATRAEGWELTPDPMPDEVIFIRSDQYSFVRRGVPAVYLVPGFSSADPDIDGGALQQEFMQNHYHQPSDDLARPVRWSSVETFTRINIRIGQEVASADEAPAWREGDFFGERFGEPRGDP